jgi:hypothetical protein
VRTVPMIGTDASVHALEMGSPSSERVAPSLAVEQKRRIRIAMITISAIAVALACTVLVLHSSSGSPAPVAEGEQWLEDGRASLSMFRVARTPMQKKVLRGPNLPHQVHYYSNVGDRLPVLGDEERETRQTFQELVQLGHTCVVMLRRAIWSVDPTVFNPQYNLQVRLDSIHTALSQLAAQTGVYLTNPPVVQVDESVFDEAANDVSRFRKLVERIPEMHNAEYYWVVQYNIIRTELRKVSSQLTATVNIAKHHFLEVADSIDSMRENVEAIHEGR